MTRTDSRSLRFGIATVVTDSSIPTVELAQWAEDRSFESLFMGGALLATTVATLDRVSAGPLPLRHRGRGEPGRDGKCDFEKETESNMSNRASDESAKAVVRRNTDEVQSKGNFDVFEELFGASPLPTQAGMSAKR